MLGLHDPIMLNLAPATIYKVGIVGTNELSVFFLPD